MIHHFYEPKELLFCVTRVYFVQLHFVGRTLFLVNHFRHVFAEVYRLDSGHGQKSLNPYPTAFPYGNGMVLHFHQQQESSTTKTVHKVINKGLKTYV